MKEKAVTHQECIDFTLAMLQMLNEKGFHVNNVQEAFICTCSIVDAQNEVEAGLEEKHGETRSLYLV